MCLHLTVIVAYDVSQGFGLSAHKILLVYKDTRWKATKLLFYNHPDQLLIQDQKQGKRTQRVQLEGV